jgi:hypothetical protein
MSDVIADRVASILTEALAPFEDFGASVGIHSYCGDTEFLRVIVWIDGEIMIGKCKILIGHQTAPEIAKLILATRQHDIRVHLRSITTTEQTSIQFQYPTNNKSPHLRLV